MNPSSLSIYLQYQYITDSTGSYFFEWTPQRASYNVQVVQKEEKDANGHPREQVVAYRVSEKVKKEQTDTPESKL